MQITSSRLRVLYEDNHLIAVYKPAGVLVQGDDTGDECLMDMVKQYLKEKYDKPGNVFLGLLHRLDRPVSGIVLFAKTSKGASRVSEQFRNHTIKKVYTALVEGSPHHQHVTLTHYLRKDEQKNKTTVFEKETPDASYAELSYVVINSGSKTSLLQIELKTGRSHQIRAQLSHIGHPIVGDVKYGAKEIMPDGNISLVATELHFKTATGEEEKHIIVDVPYSVY